MRDDFICIDAEETLARFIDRDWPDEEKFRTVISELLVRARKAGRPVRAFGEMVAILWARGQNAATIRLEHLWHEYCRIQDFNLFCAYPRSGITSDADNSLREICAAHSRVIPG